MSLYNCKIDGDQWKISKFTNDGELESSYLTTHAECQCPAGQRPSCRHRQMLPAFLDLNLVNSYLFLDWDNGRRIVDFNGQPATLELAPQALTDTIDCTPSIEPAIEPGTYTVTQPDEDGMAEIVSGHHRGRKIKLPSANGWRRW